MVHPRAAAPPVRPGVGRGGHGLTTTRQQWACFAGGAAVLVLTGVIASGTTPTDAERSIGQWVYDLPRWLGRILELVMACGRPIAIVLVAAALVVAGRYRAALAAGIAGAAAWFAASLLKEWVERPRPTRATLGRVPREVVDTFSWPSTHAAIAFALATVLLLTLAKGRAGRALVGAAAVLTAFGRLYVGAHWGLDVLGGAALGALVGGVTVAVVRP